MTTKETHEKAMSKVGELRHLNMYRAADDMMRLSCCAYLQLSNMDGVKEQGIDRYCNIGDVLISAAEHFGDRTDKKETYEVWNERTKNDLQDLYKCKLTGDYCVSRMKSFHRSDIPEGDCNEVISNVDIQIRCPSFKFKDGLLEKLKE